MSAAVVDFRRRFPHASLEFQTETSSRGCFVVLAAGGVDLAWITLGPAARTIEQRPVVELPWALAVSAADPLAAKAFVEPADLQDARLIGLPENSTSRVQLGTWLAESGIRPVFDTSVADWDTAILLAELGLGHTVVPTLPAWSGPGHPDLRLIPSPRSPSSPQAGQCAAGMPIRPWPAPSPRPPHTTAAGSPSVDSGRLRDVSCPRVGISRSTRSPLTAASTGACQFQPETGGSGHLGGLAGPGPSGAAGPRSLACGHLRKIVFF